MNIINLSTLGSDALFFVRRSYIVGYKKLIYYKQLNKIRSVLGYYNDYSRCACLNPECAKYILLNDYEVIPKLKVHVISCGSRYIFKCHQ